jgi:hypothetical protein
MNESKEEKTDNKKTETQHTHYSPDFFSSRNLFGNHLKMNLIKL